MFLVDTNTISELRKVELGRANAQVAAWEKQHKPSELWVSVVTLMEIEIGILKLAGRNETHAQRLRDWQNSFVLPFFEGRTLDITREIAMRCATLHVARSQPANDALIAATALVHGLTVATRNVADFAPMGVKLINPWESQE
jgi:toxin FitB